MKKLTKNNIKIIIKEEYESIQNEISEKPSAFNIKSLLENIDPAGENLGNKFKEAIYSVLRDVQYGEKYSDMEVIRESGKSSTKTFNVITKTDTDAGDLREVLTGCNIKYLDVGTGRHTIFLERNSKRAGTIISYLKKEDIKFAEANKDWK